VSSGPLADRPPQAGRVLGGAFGAGEERAGWRTTLRELPAWARVAAAILFVGLAASIANLRVEYNQAGLTVRTGWLTPAAVPEAVPVPDTDPTPWRVELTALREELRGEMRASTPDQKVDANALLRRVQQLIEDSEQKQQRELALRIAEVDTSVRAQRIADLRNIDRNLNVIQSNTGVDMRRLYEMTNSLAVRVSQPR
jgi:hypothetical protein